MHVKTCVLQVFGDLVPVEVSDHHAPSPVHNRDNLVGVDDYNDPVGVVLRHGGHIQGRAQPGTVPGGVAGVPGREPVFPAGQPRAVLRGADGGHIAVLRDDMDQGVATDHTDGQQGRADGAHTAEEQGEGGENADHGRHTFRRVVAAAVRDIHAHQTGRPAHVLGRGLPARGHADRPVAGRVQQLHQPGAVCVLQQEVPPRVHGRAAEQKLLGHRQVQRERGCKLVVVRQQSVLLHHQSSRVHQASGQPGDQRVLHIQRLNRRGETKRRSIFIVQISVCRKQNKPPLRIA